MKLCKDCQHSFMGTVYMKCTAQINVRRPDYVNGGVELKRTDAQDVRVDEDMCSPDAKYWEPKTDVDIGLGDVPC